MTADGPGPGAPVVRDGARVLLLDPQRNVLLIHERIQGGTHWLTPGGGREPGESLIDAAVRELHEETGLHVDLDSQEPVHVVQRRWTWRDKTYLQTDHFFLFELNERPTLSPAALTEQEQETLLDMRWWPVDELRRLQDVIEPPDLCDLLDRLRPPRLADA
jgi:8-oxo-dGTP pyrophosphatase MutT (NUDIX family)